MSDEDDFSRLISRIGEGDESAFEEFFNDYFEHVLRVVRRELRDRRRRHEFDSQEVCQSVLYRLYDGIVMGTIQLENPASLHALFCAMARCKVVTHARRLHAGRRDIRRTADGAVEDFALASADGDPSDEMSQNEQCEKFYAELTVGQATVLALRRDGQSWAEIGRATGATPDAARMSTARMLARASEMFDTALSEDDDRVRTKRRPK